MSGSFRALLQSLHRWAAAGEVGGLTDAELVERFTSRGDEAAFEVLVWRHGPAVLGVCRSMLSGAPDVEDAFQATFLVLVKKAGSIGRRAAVGRWLCRVAYRVALEARARARRVAARERRRPARPTELSAAEEVLRRDLWGALREEVEQLPEKYRLPVLLCYFGGQSTAEATRSLGCPRGTVLSRLAGARQRLRGRLARRGVTLSAGALAAALAPAASAVGIPTTLVRWTLQAALWFATGPAGDAGAPRATVLALTEGVLQAMFWKKIKVVAAVLVTAALAGAGGGLWLRPPAAGNAFARGQDQVPEVRGEGDRTKSAQPPASGPFGLASGGNAPGRPSTPPATTGAKDSPPAPAAPLGRRREAVIRLPLGTWVKEIEVPPYGSGRLTWQYEEDRVLGFIEAAVLGGEIQLSTEAEYSLSSNGTIYGIITSVKFHRLRLPEGEEFADLKRYLGFWPAVEPLVSEVLTDLPFSYQFRVSGDRLVISHFRMLLCGPNPLGKLGAVLAQDNQFALLGYFQGLAVLEGTYTAADAKEKEAPLRSPPFGKPRGRGTARPPATPPATLPLPLDTPHVPGVLPDPR
jgi:RNA polymerase sigma factor (sigma-70 family)